MTAVETPADGVITGYGIIDGNLVYVYSQDASVLGGAIGEMHAKKISKIYDLALKVGAPVIGLVDCAGMRLQEATDALNAFGELYFKQTGIRRYSSGDSDSGNLRRRCSHDSCHDRFHFDD